MKKFEQLVEKVLNEIECGANISITITSPNTSDIVKFYNNNFIGRGLWFELSDDVKSIYISGTQELIDEFIMNLDGSGIEYEIPVVDGDEEVV